MARRTAMKEQTYMQIDPSTISKKAIEEETDVRTENSQTPKNVMKDQRDEGTMPFSATESLKTTKRKLKLPS